MIINFNISLNFQGDNLMEEINLKAQQVKEAVGVYKDAVIKLIERVRVDVDHMKEVITSGANPTEVLGTLDSIIVDLNKSTTELITVDPLPDFPMPNPTPDPLSDLSRSSPQGVPLPDANTDPKATPAEINDRNDPNTPGGRNVNPRPVRGPNENTDSRTQRLADEAGKDDQKSSANNEADLDADTEDEENNDE